MTTSLNELFAELEGTLPEDLNGFQQRRIRPEATVDLFVAVANPSRHRSVILELTREVAIDAEVHDDIRGIEITLRHPRGQGRSALTVTLIDPGASDLFSVLCEDVTSASAAATDEKSALDLFLGRLAKWQRFLARAVRGLTPEQQRGLFSELWVLRTHVAPHCGAARAIEAWLGPTGAVRDFEGTGGALEIKSSIANQPQVAKINGEKQLDDSGVPQLFLGHLALDTHRDHGQTLPEAVAASRDLADGGAAAALLEERLFEAGYHDLHAAMYQRQGYDVQRFDVFAVTDGFPRLVGKDLPDGVGGLRYQLSIAACAPFSVDASQLAGCPVARVGGEDD